jgi:shikimate kinase
MPVADVFAHYGEPHFRELERRAVADACSSPEPLVVACGGGAIVDAENRTRLRACGTVVWLRAPVAVLAARVGDDHARPLLAGDSERALSRLDAIRADAYDAAAHARVDTEGRSIDEVAHAVVTAFRAAEQ